MRPVGQEEPTSDPASRASGLWWSPRVVVPSAWFMLFSVGLVLSAVVWAAPLTWQRTTWDRGAFGTCAGLFLAAASMRFFAPRTVARRLGLLGGAALFLYGVLQPVPEYVGEPWAVHAMWSAVFAAAGAMGLLGVTRCLRPSPELRLSYYSLVGASLGFVALAFLAGFRTWGPGPVVEPAVLLLVLAWRAAVLTRRGAW